MLVASRAPTRRSPALTAAALAAGVGAVVLFDPQHRHVPLCPFHAATGLWCPLCGGLRAVDALAHLRIGLAVHENLLVVAGLPVAVLVWVLWWQRSRAGRTTRVPRAVGVTLAVLLVVFAVVRNLPFAAALRPR